MSGFEFIPWQRSGRRDFYIDADTQLVSELILKSISDQIGLFLGAGSHFHVKQQFLHTFAGIDMGFEFGNLPELSYHGLYSARINVHSADGHHVIRPGQDPAHQHSKGAPARARLFLGEPHQVPGAVTDDRKAPTTQIG